MSRKLRNRVVSYSQADSSPTLSEMGETDKKCTNEDLMKVLLSNKEDLMSLRNDMSTMQQDIVDIKLKQSTLTTDFENLGERMGDLETDVIDRPKQY